MQRTTAPSPEIVVQLPEQSDVPAAEVRDRIRDVFDVAPTRVLHARVHVVRHSDPRVARPFVATAVLDLNGRPVRVEAAARTERDALDGMRHKLTAVLTHRMQRAVGSWEARRARVAVSGKHEWRHGAEAAHRPPYFPRTREERQLIPHLSVTQGPVDLDTAALDMADMDYRFHLFTELGSQQDSVLYISPSGLRLAQVEPQPEALAPHLISVLVAPHEAPVLTVDDAMQQLEAWERPFLLFLDPDRGRGVVLYHRFDGHYGLVTPGLTPGS